LLLLLLLWTDGRAIVQGLQGTLRPGNNGPPLANRGLLRRAGFCLGHQAEIALVGKSLLRLCTKRMVHKSWTNKGWVMKS